MKGLDFESERYVRVYTRDTPDFCLLSWEAQAVHLALQRKLDRAGVLELGEHSAARAVAAVLRWPPPVVDVALAELLAAGLYQLRPGFLLDPVFVEAQEAKQNDAARARASRERRRARASAEAAGLPVTIRDESVRGSDTRTKVDETSHQTLIQAESSSVTARDADITPRDTQSRSGRKRHSVLSRAVLSRAEESSSTCVDSPVLQVFEFWKADTGHVRAKLDSKRKSRIKARLRDFSVEELQAAIRNRRNDPWLMGTTPKSTRVFDDLKTLLRDTEQVERLRDLTVPAPTNNARWQPQTGGYDVASAGNDDWANTNCGEAT